MRNLQDKPIVVGNPIEIDFACNELRKQIATLPWVSHPYFIAQKFFFQDATTKKKFIYPETYAPDVDNVQDQATNPYHRLTPDSSYSGMCFFMVGKNKNDYTRAQHNYLTYPVSIIFSVNLDLIDQARLRQELFTQTLMRQVRRLLTNVSLNYEFGYKILSETRDLQECYREFKLNEIEQYNRAPLQCFRFDLELTIQEFCGDEPTGIPPTGNEGIGVNITVLNVDVPPLAIQPNTTFLILNINNMVNDLEIANYTPTGLVKGATVRIRKIDDSPFKITYNKDGLEYSFVDRQTEFIDLLWDGSELII